MYSKQTIARLVVAFLKWNMSTFWGIDGKGIHYSILLYSPLIVVQYHSSNEKPDLSMNDHRVTIVPTIEESPLPINKLKNIGIDHVKTSHFLFVEFNFIPSSFSTHLK